ncbi:1-acyl-sn-glycerol-3-phosphate acyltransferase [Georgenia sp. M64]|uniref:1-acyl-sn-glycerol-3-phosphate acyltransferase n=1 Tax=Georgenia sp. M64 TaxID=3120520 RepID=UPI0030E34E3F
MRTLRHAFARLVWTVTGYRHVSQPLAPDGAGLLIGAPHTSNWDFILMLGITWELDLETRWLGKHQLFLRPFGPLMRALGGIPVDRRSPHGLVSDIVGRIRSGERFYLVVTPEGTRGRSEYWKSGFYRIAMEAGLPVTLGYVDSERRTTGLGPTLRLTGDVAADMDKVREFYAGKLGYRPDLTTEPRLRDETGTPSASA